jgi:polysaccharide export outer membrane protein
MTSACHRGAPVAAAAVAPVAAAKAPGAGGQNAAKDNQQYVIGPGDVLSVFVYQSPQLTTEGLPVRPDGMISVPLVQDMLAAGKTPSQLGHDIAEKLRKYVQEPNVTVMVRGFQGPSDRQVRVIGEATDPQALAYREDMTILDVMIATHGLTKFAAGNRAKIIRIEAGQEIDIPVHLTDLMDGDTSQNVRLRPGDTLIIPQSWF